MKFLYPQFLYALFALAIPILIHLFNFKKYKVLYFSDISLLKSLKEKTKSQSQLKHLLIFLSRALAFIFIVLAFSQPYIPNQAEQVQVNKHAVSVFIDNSFSMNRTNKNGSLLNDAKSKASQVLDAYNETDDFHLLSNHFKGSSSRISTKENCKKDINQIKNSSVHRELELIIKKQINALAVSEAVKKDLYIISDFSNFKSDLSSLKLDSNISINLIQIESDNRNNLFIDSCWFNSPILTTNKELTLNVRIKNDGNESLTNQNIKLFIENEQIAISNFDITDETIVPISFIASKNGWNKAQIKIDDIPITFDNTFYISFKVKQKINVVTIFENEESKSLKALFEKDNFFDYYSYSKNQIKYDSFKNYDLIILDEVENISTGLSKYLQTHIKNGGSLLVFPSINLNSSSYNQLSDNLSIDRYGDLIEGQMIAEINFDHPVFSGVFEKKSSKLNLPNIKQFYEIKNSRFSVDAIMSYSDKKAVFKQYSFDKGKVYLSSVGLDKTFGNLSKHALFVPIIYNISAITSGSQNLSYNIGQSKIENSANVSSNNTFISNNNTQFLPELEANWIWINNQIKDAGFYDLVSNDSSYSKLAFNYDRKESSFSAFDFNNIKKDFDKKTIMLLNGDTKNLTSKIEKIKDGFSLWTICIILTIFLLATETLFLKLL